MKTLFAIVCLVFPALAFGATPDTPAPAKERFIPIELWAGAAWDGKPELRMPPVNGTYANTSPYTIKGPISWKHPETGEATEVYERLYYDRQGMKKQLFTLNTDKSGLGRLYDDRPGMYARYSSGGLKFPVGLWQEGETRRFTYRAWGRRNHERVESITIRQIDFTYQGIEHCLEFYWEATDRATNQREDQNTYTYCPGKSMVRQVR